jgi:hypothetical protein
MDIYNAGSYEPIISSNDESLMIKEIKEIKKIKRLDFFSPSSEEIHSGLVHTDFPHPGSSNEESIPDAIHTDVVHSAPIHTGFFEYDWRNATPPTPQPSPNPIINQPVKELSLQLVHNPPSVRNNRDRMWIMKAQINWKDGTQGSEWQHRMSAKTATNKSENPKFLGYLDEVMADYAKRSLTQEEKADLKRWGERILDTLDAKEWQAYGLLQPVTGGRPKNPRAMWGFCGFRFYGNPSLKEPNFMNEGEVFMWLGDDYWRLPFRKGDFHAKQFYWKAYWFDGSGKTQHNNGPRMSEDDW